LLVFHDVSSNVDAVPDHLRDPDGPFCNAACERRF
jgi:hypothetical protein